MTLNWLFNIWLYLMFTLNPPVYEALKAQGAACFVQVDTSFIPITGLGIGGDVQPDCWYDPSNLNDGHAKVK
jgi:hypothetical protein